MKPELSQAELSQLREQTKEKIRYIISQTYRRGGFYARVLKRLNVGISWSCPTAYATKKGIYFSPHFVNRLNSEELVFLMCHEILHIAFKHHSRGLDKIQDLWNVSCDYAINGILITDLVGRMPQGGIHDERFTGMSSEEIYDQIYNSPETRFITCDIKDLENFDGAGEEDVQTGTFNETSEEQANNILDSDIQEEISSSQKSANALRKYMEGHLQSRVHWLEVLRDFMSASAYQTKWKLPNRRHIHSETFLYKIKREKKYSMGQYILAVDPSGSMGAEEMAAIFSEIAELINCFDSKGILVLWGDGTDIYEQKISSPSDIESLKGLPGGGGHDFQAMLDHVEKNSYQQNMPALIYFTDGYNPEPTRPYWSDKIIWVYTGKKSFDWGKDVFYGK